MHDGEIINVVCSFADITEQKRLSKELINRNSKTKATNTGYY